jgi:membrane-associated phospholipid phosphatase
MGEKRSIGLAELALGTLGVVCVVALARRVNRRGPLRVDRRVRRRVRRARNPVFDVAAAALYLPGYPAVYFPATALVARALKHRDLAAADMPLAAAGAAWVAQRAIKQLVHRRRPPGRHREPGSFPSGHTTPTTAIALATALVLARAGRARPLPLVALTLGVPVSVGLARVYRDAHWMTDVIGGWMAGASLALLFDAIGGRPPDSKPRR